MQADNASAIGRLCLLNIAGWLFIIVQYSISEIPFAISVATIASLLINHIFLMSCEMYGGEITRLLKTWLLVGVGVFCSSFSYDLIFVEWSVNSMCWFAMLSVVFIFCYNVFADHKVKEVSFAVHLIKKLPANQIAYSVFSALVIFSATELEIFLIVSFGIIGVIASLFLSVWLLLTVFKAINQFEMNPYIALLSVAMAVALLVAFADFDIFFLASDLLSISTFLVLGNIFWFIVIMKTKMFPR